MEEKNIEPFTLQKFTPMELRLYADRFFNQSTPSEVPAFSYFSLFRGPFSILAS